MIKSVAVVLTCLFLQLQGLVRAQGKESQTYLGEETQRILVFTPDKKFYLINEEKPMVVQQDTMSFGTYKTINSFLLLNTPKKIQSNVLNVRVNETFEETDSIRITIHNPYEQKYHRTNKEAPRFFHYWLQINSSDNSFGPAQSMDFNQISLYKAKKEAIYDITVFIVPLCIYYPSTPAFNYLQTKSYKVKNLNSNVFEIQIPDFTFDYIGYERYRDEYVKVLSEKTILLRGEKFRRIK